MTLRFWCAQERTTEVLKWDPDREPERYADGFGHNVMELAARLAGRGKKISVGPTVLEHDVLVVFLPSLLERRDQLRLLRRLARWPSTRLVLLRSDFPATYSFPIRPSLEVMPNTSSLIARHQMWIPPLPQRGLVKRDGLRGDMMKTLSFKGYPENDPVGEDSVWLAGLQALGLSWRPDLRDPATGANDWHNFENVDLSLCLRKESSPNTRVGWLRKPATKLINAWCAETIPLIGREPGYLELARPREDSMIVESVEHVLDVVSELRHDPMLVSRLREGVRRRASEFRVDGVLDAWATVLDGPIEPVPTRKLAALAKGSRVGARWLVDAARGDRLSPIWRPEH